MRFVRHTNGVNYINAYGIKMSLRIFKVFESAVNRGFYGGQLGKLKVNLNKTTKRHKIGIS